MPARRERYGTLGPVVADWLERNIRHTTSEWAGDPLVLEPWQRAWLDELFLIDSKGRRVYRTGTLGVPKKNGKSMLSSGLALNGLCADITPKGTLEQDPKVFAAAASKDQTRPVFEQAYDTVKASPRLARKLVPMQSVIKCPETKGRFRALAADSGKIHGINCSRWVADEYHAHQDEKVVTVLRKSGIARPQSLGIILTHAGYDEESPAGKRFTDAMAHPDLEQPHPGLWVVRDRAARSLFWWYGAAEDADFEDPAVWMAANPASWLDEEKLAEEFREPDTRVEDFRRFNLNQWISVEASFLPPGLWKQLRDERSSTFKDGERIWIGVDVAIKHDQTAIVICAPTDNGRFKLQLAKILHANNRGPSMRKRAKAYVKELARRYEVVGMAYDKYAFEDEADELADFIETIEHGQGTPMARGTTRFYRYAKQGRICHDGDETLARHVGNAVVRETDMGVYRIAKRTKSSKKKIDAAAAAIMALNICAMECGEYDDDEDPEDEDEGTELARAGADDDDGWSFGW